MKDLGAMNQILAMKVITERKDRKSGWHKALCEEDFALIRHIKRKISEYSFSCPPKGYSQSNVQALKKKK